MRSRPARRHLQRARRRPQKTARRSSVSTTSADKNYLARRVQPAVLVQIMQESDQPAAPVVRRRIAALRPGPDQLHRAVEDVVVDEAVVGETLAVNHKAEVSSATNSRSIRNKSSSIRVMHRCLKPPIRCAAEARRTRHLSPNSLFVPQEDLMAVVVAASASRPEVVRRAVQSLDHQARSLQYPSKSTSHRHRHITSCAILQRARNPVLSTGTSTLQCIICIVF